MSQQALDAFKAKLAQDEALRKEMASTLSEGGKKATASVDEVLAFAKSKGFDIDIDELRKSVELTDDELDRVAGGVMDVFLRIGSANGETNDKQTDIDLLSWSLSAYR